jgi:ferredoxin
MNSDQLRALPPQFARGDFYVEAGCCTACGVPQAAAPDLVGWTDEGYVQCSWKKQPETPEELERAFAIFDGQELGCHRYAGHDPKIQLRIGSGDCDFRDAWRTADGLPIEPVESKAPDFWTESTFWERIRARFTKR